MERAEEHGHPMRLLIAGGGTGGHVLPALAVVAELRDRGVLDSILWIGSHTGVEKDEAFRADIPFRAIQTGKLRRYPSIQTFTDAARIPVGLVQARRIVQNFRPHVVLSTGGFVSVPTVFAARGIAPSLTHEQTAILGLATRINMRTARVVAVSYEETATVGRTLHRQVIVTGNPVRSILNQGSADRARARWGLVNGLPLLYVTGGARGASAINQRLEQMLPALLDVCQVVHQTGPSSMSDDLARLTRLRAAWSSDYQARYSVVDFIGPEIADLYAATDLVIGRAGAGTVAELAFLGRPAVLIPLPGAGGDEQTRNANLLAAIGGAVVIPQEKATPDYLSSVVRTLLADRPQLDNMGKQAAKAGRPDAAARLADALLDLAASRTGSSRA